MNGSREDLSAEMMRRREVLRRVAWMLGGALSAPAALAILQGCSARDAPAAGWTPKFFKGTQADVVSVIADIMIPKTDTSGALDAGVPAFVDLMLADVYPEDSRLRFNEGYAKFELEAGADGKPFLEQQRAAQTAFVKQSLQRALDGERNPPPFILMARELTLLGFFSSKVGITENMEYVAVPAAYHGCVPLPSMKKRVYWE